MSNQKTPKAPMPDWLRTLLEQTTGGFRNARWDRCKDCGEITLHGMDGDICAGMATVDPTPLTPQQEHWCALTGRDTYSANIDADRRTQLWRRTKWALAKPHNRPIFPAHICGQRYDGFAEELKKPPTTRTGGPPPF